MDQLPPIIPTLQLHPFAKFPAVIARKLCWIFTIEGLETYILVPRDSADYDQLLEAVSAQPSPLDLDVVVGHTWANCTAGNVQWTDASTHCLRQA